MIKGFVQGQTLKLSQTRVVADTIDYLIAKFTFQGEDWRGLDKWMHLKRGEEAYAVRLTDGKTKKEDHLNLGAGRWSVWLHGNEQADGQVTLRITTNVCEFDVEASGALEGDALPELPAGVGEQLTARVDALEQQTENTPVLPSIDADDDGKVLTVVGGAWQAADAPSGGSDIVVDAELSDTSENPVQNKVIAQVAADANEAMTQLGITVAALGQRVTPEVTEEDESKMLQVVDGVWTAVSVADSSIKTYIDDYINEALGGDY